MNPEFAYDLGNIKTGKAQEFDWNLDIPNENCHDWKCDWKYVLGYDKSTRAPPICISDAEEIY